MELPADVESYFKAFPCPKPLRLVVYGQFALGFEQLALKMLQFQV